MKLKVMETVSVRFGYNILHHNLLGNMYNNISFNKDDMDYTNNEMNLMSLIGFFFFKKKASASERSERVRDKEECTGKCERKRRHRFAGERRWQPGWE